MVDSRVETANQGERGGIVGTDRFGHVDRVTVMSHDKAITVLYFAAASTATGLTSEAVLLPWYPYKLCELAELLSHRHPGDLCEVLKSSRWSVNAEMVDDHDVDAMHLNGGEEVAVICPVSGG